MSARTRIALAAMAAAFSLAVVSPAMAGTLDQQQLGTYTHFAVVDFTGVGQTFTAGRSGSLDQVDLFLYRIGATSPLTVEIRDASGNLPGATVLASASVTAAQVPVGSNGFPSTLISVPLASPVPVVGGTQYAIVAYTTPTSGVGYGLGLTCGVSSYTRGQEAQSQSLTTTNPVPSSWNTFGQDCDFRFSTYVAPWDFSGFFSPVNNPTDPEPLNGVKAGSSVPVKFSLGGNQGLGVVADGYPKLVFTPCDSGDPDPVEETSTANSGLTYDASTDTYTYVWKTQKAWAKKCGTLTIKLADDTVHTADFQFK